MINQTTFLGAILFLFTTFACQDVTPLENQISELKNQLDSTQTLLSNTQTAMQEKEGFIHTVFFWMKEDLSEADRTRFETNLQTLSKIETVKKLYWGKPAGTPARGVVDNSYDYALIVHFADAAGQDAYQPHEIHQAFVNNTSDTWTKVVVYDSLVQ